MPAVFTFRPTAVDDLLNDPAGPVGRLIAELSGRVAVIARRAVPVRDPATRNRRRRAGLHSTAHAPGYTKANIRVHGPVRGHSSLYGGVNAPGSPAIFLEYPASQMTRKYPFLTTGLDSLSL